MCKTVRIFQQSFIHDSFNDTSLQHKFNFTRVMKTKQSQHFHLKVLAVISETDDNLLYLKDLPNINMNCNIQEKGIGSTSDSNTFVLGGTGTNFGVVEMMCDELPTSPFTLESTIAEDYTVVFQIEVRES